MFQRLIGYAWLNNTPTLVLIGRIMLILTSNHSVYSITNIISGNLNYRQNRWQFQIQQNSPETAMQLLGAIVSGARRYPVIPKPWQPPNSQTSTEKRLAPREQNKAYIRTKKALRNLFIFIYLCLVYYY